MSALPAQVQPVYTEISLADLSRPALPAGGELHLWQIPVRAAKPEDLNESEMIRARRFHQPADADRFSSARLALRRIAAAYLEIAPRDVLILGERHEKPVFGNRLPRPLHFNMSHSGGLVLIAFAGEPLGVDIEQINPRFDPDDLLPAHFSLAERSAISGSPDPLAAFYQLWTRKEALTKARGTGLQEDLREVAVAEDLVRSAEGAAGPWRLMSFIPRPGYTAAIACNVSPGGIVFYRAI